MDLTIKQKNIIYDYLYDNRFKFLYKKTESDRIDAINKIIFDNFNIFFYSFDQCFNYLTQHWDKKCKNPSCENNRKLISLFPNRIHYENPYRKYGIFKFCHLKECNYTSISDRQMGDKNTIHRTTPEKNKKMRKKLSEIMISKIKNGEFMPNITNSWAKSRCDINFIRDGEFIKIKTRSSWEAYFQLFNKNFIYEKIIIPYRHNKVERNYIIDFVDYENKVLYEIKPDSVRNDKRNISKFKYARKWCRENGFKFKIITDKWFHKNYKEELIYGQPSEDKIIKNLKQFK